MPVLKLDMTHEMKMVVLLEVQTKQKTFASPYDNTKTSRHKELAVLISSTQFLQINVM
jgi:hypothetical protein